MDADEATTDDTEPEPMTEPDAPPTPEEAPENRVEPEVDVDEEESLEEEVARLREENEALQRQLTRKDVQLRNLQRKANAYANLIDAFMQKVQMTTGELQDKRNSLVAQLDQELEEVPGEDEKPGVPEDLGAGE